MNNNLAVLFKYAIKVFIYNGENYWRCAAVAQFGRAADSKAEAVKPAETSRSPVRVGPAAPLSNLDEMT